MISPQRTALQTEIAATVVRDGALDNRDLERAVALQKTYKEDLRSILEKLGLLAPEAWASAASRVLGIPQLTRDDLFSASRQDNRVTEEFLRENHIILLTATEGRWRLAMADPTNSFASQAVSQALGAPVSPCVAMAREIEEAQEDLFGRDRAQGEGEEQSVSFSLGDVHADDIERLKGLAGEAPVIRFVNTMIKRAFEMGASDIHLEPFEKRFSVRYRIDGLLTSAEAPPLSMAPAIVSRLKILAHLDIAERRLAQDGRIHFRSEGQELDLRIATIPSLYGESVVVRLLEQAGAPPGLADLGMAGPLEAVFRRNLHRKHGLILVTGPTGSGKTTTLYAALNCLNDIDRKIITIEDPIEFQIDQIVQTQVKPAIGLDFAGLLKAIVRQDPDVIMLGEMRDGETATTAVRSALTGHLVLSTLHTNDAVSAVTRLLDMGVADYLLTSTVNLSIAQRLVRTLCTECREPVAPSDALLRALERNGMEMPAGGATVMAARGCPHCMGRGFRGRTAVYEFFEPDEACRNLVLRHADTAALREEARRAGMTTLYQDGLAKVLQGITTFEEVERLAQDSF